MAWNLKANLKGPKGDKGDKGDQGLPSIGQVPEDAGVAAYVGTTSLTQTALDQRFHRVLTPELFGAVGDGVTDDVAAFTALVSAMTPGVTVQCRSDVRYAISAGITVTGIDGWEWIGGSFLFTADTASTSGGGGAAFRIDGCDDVRVTGMRLEQAVQAADRQFSGISVDNSTAVLLTDVTAYNFRWTGIGVGGTSKDVTIRDCQGLRCYVGGYVAGNGPSGVKFLGGRFSSEWSQTQEYIDVAGIWQTSSWYYDGIIIAGEAWAVEGVTLDDNGQSGIYGGTGNVGGIIAGCTVTGNWNKGIDFGDAAGSVIDQLVIQGNSVSGNATGDISLAHATRCVISGNRVQATKSFAIGLNDGCEDNVVVGNQVVSIVPDSAIFVGATAVRNSILYNAVAASSAYNVDATANTVVALTAQGDSRRSGMIVDLSASSGFGGRNALGLYASADNTAVQVSANMPVELLTPDGVPQAFTVGAVTAGAVFALNGGTMHPPQVPTNVEGYIWYDPVAKKLKFHDGTAERTVTSV